MIEQPACQKAVRSRHPGEATRQPERPEIEGFARVEEDARAGSAGRCGFDFCGRPPKRTAWPPRRAGMTRSPLSRRALTRSVV